MTDDDKAGGEAIIRALTPREPDEQPPEPPVEGMPARDKPASEYSEAEWEATREHTRRTLRLRDRDHEQDRQRQEAEAARTDEQRLGDAVISQLSSAAKRAREAGLVRSIHPDGGEDE